MAVYRLSDTFSVAPAWAALNNNLLHNGAMQVAQRGTSTASITTGGYYTADRWNFTLSSLGTWTQSVESDAPTGSGFAKSLKLLCTTADAAPAAADYAFVRQGLEGQNIQRIAKGTSSAQQLTLSFWVKSNATGTYTIWLYDADNARQVSASYSILASATWERKTITFPADTTGAFANDNGESLSVYFVLAAGSNRTSGALGTVWQAYADANQSAGQTNLAATINNYWQITGVQLEVGPVATPFEFKDYGTELRECQRYFYMHANGASLSICTGAYFSAAQVRGVVAFPTTMRDAPVISVASGTDYFVAESPGGNDAFSTLIIYKAGVNAATVYQDTNVSGTAGHAATIHTNNASAYLGFTADL